MTSITRDFSNTNNDLINLTHAPTQSRTYAPFDRKKATADNPFVAFMKRIWEGIKWIFEQIGNFFKNIFCKKPELKLSELEINMIQNAKPSKKPQAPPSPKLPSKMKVSHVNALLDYDIIKKSKVEKDKSELLDALDLPKQSAKSAPTEKKEVKEMLSPIKDPVMKEFHDTAQQFVEIVLDCAFDKYIEPKLGDLKEGLGNLSSCLKFGANLAFQIGEKAGKPIFEKLNQFSIDEKSEFQSLLAWLLKEGTPSDLESKLKESLKKEFDAEVELNQYVQICLEWLVKSDHKSSVHEAFAAAGIEVKGHKELIDKVYEGAMFLLLDEKITKFIANCNDKLDGKLAQIIRQAVVENGKIISDILVRRMINIIDNTKFPEMFDTLVKVTADQTEALVAMDKAKELEISAQQALLVKAKKAKTMKAETPEENKTKFELLQHLENVEKAGGEELWIARKAEQKALEAYLNFGAKQGPGSGFCHPRIAELLQNPNLSPNQKAKIEEELFKGLADEIIPLVFPKQKVELPTGEIKEVDSLVYLCSQIDIPGEFKELAKEALDISKEILTPGTQKIIKGIYDTVWEFAGDQIQDSIANEAKEVLKKGVKAGARALFENFITPNNINDMVGQEVLPYVQQKLFSTIGLEVIEQNQATFAPLFHTLNSAKSEEERKEVLSKMLAIITPKVKTSAALSAEVFADMGDDEFEKLMLDELAAIENGILAYQESKQLQTEESVKVALEGYLKLTKVESNPYFGDLAVNLVFKLGKFNSAAEFFSDLFKGLISEQISAVTKKMSQSPNFLMEKVTHLIKKKYLNKEKVNELIFDKTNEKSSAEVEAKLKSEIERTAKVAKDLVSFKVDQLSWGAKLIAKPVVASIVGDDEKKLAQLISTIYEKMFGDRLITHNLIIRIQEQLMKFMMRGSFKYAQGEGLKPIKVAQMPSIIPELFV